MTIYKVNYPPGYLSIPSDIKDPLTYYYAYNPGYKRLENIISGKLPVLKSCRRKLLSKVKLMYDKHGSFRMTQK